MDLFVHARGRDVLLVEASASDAVSDVAAKAGSPDGEVWLEGQDAPLSRTASLAEAGVQARANLHVGTCKKVAVAVRFQTTTKTYDVPPSATLQAIFEKACSKGDGFGLSDVDRTQYTLQVHGTTDQPELSRHVGVFATDDCSASFDLVLQDRFQG